MFLSRTFVLPVSLPAVVQYFSWAPTGNKYVSLHHVIMCPYHVQYHSYVNITSFEICCFGMWGSMGCVACRKINIRPCRTSVNGVFYEVKIWICGMYLYCICNQNHQKLEINFVFQAYVSDYNIYFKSNVTAEAVQVTHNGKKDEILNGVPDWVYEGKYPLFPHVCICVSIWNMVTGFFFLQQIQRKCLHLTGQYGGRRLENTWLTWSLMTQMFPKWSSLGMDLSSILRPWLFHTQRWDTDILNW